MLPASPLHTPFLGRAVSVTPRCILTFNNNLWWQPFHMPVWSFYFPDPHDFSVAVSSACTLPALGYLPHNLFVCGRFPDGQLDFQILDIPNGPSRPQRQNLLKRWEFRPSPDLGTAVCVWPALGDWYAQSSWRIPVSACKQLWVPHSRGDSTADTGEGRQQSTTAQGTASRGFNCG